MPGKLIVVVGGQFGSEAKGHVAGQLAKRENANLVIRVGGPNAGHTWVEGELTHKLRQLPTATVSNPRSTIAIGAGALIDPELLFREMEATGTGRVLIDPAATILEPKHREAEEEDLDMQWGSTKEGIGAARMDRVHRTAVTARDYFSPIDYGYGSDGNAVLRVEHTNVARLAHDTLSWGGTVLIEAAQGYGLGLHTNYYPKTTSADCRAIDALADVGISPWAIAGAELQVWVVVRPYPIRVAGESGPLVDETSWEALGLAEERTTVTNKVRRVGVWDPELVEEALRANGAEGGPAVRVVLTMLDQVVPATRNMDAPYQIQMMDKDEFEQVKDWIELVAACGAPVAAVTTSPNTIVWLDHPTLTGSLGIDEEQRRGALVPDGDFVIEERVGAERPDHDGE